MMSLNLISLKKKIHKSISLLILLSFSLNCLASIQLNPKNLSKPDCPATDTVLGAPKVDSSFSDLFNFFQNTDGCGQVKVEIKSSDLTPLYCKNVKSCSEKQESFFTGMKSKDEKILELAHDLMIQDSISNAVDFDLTNIRKLEIIKLKAINFLDATKNSLYRCEEESEMNNSCVSDPNEDQAIKSELLFRKNKIIAENSRGSEKDNMAQVIISDKKSSDQNFLDAFKPDKSQLRQDTRSLITSEIVDTFKAEMQTSSEINQSNIDAFLVKNLMNLKTMQEYAIDKKTFTIYLSNAIKADKLSAKDLENSSEEDLQKIFEKYLNKIKLNVANQTIKDNCHLSIARVCKKIDNNLKTASLFDRHKNPETFIDALLKNKKDFRSFLSKKGDINKDKISSLDKEIDLIESFKKPENEQLIRTFFTSLQLNSCVGKNGTILSKTQTIAIKNRQKETESNLLAAQSTIISNLEDVVRSDPTLRKELADMGVKIQDASGRSDGKEGENKVSTDVSTQQLAVSPTSQAQSLASTNPTSSSQTQFTSDEGNQLSNVPQQQQLQSIKDIENKIAQMENRQNNSSKKDSTEATSALETKPASSDSAEIQSLKAELAALKEKNNFDSKIAKNKEAQVNDGADESSVVAAPKSSSRLASQNNDSQESSSNNSAINKPIDNGVAGQASIANSAKNTSDKYNGGIVLTKSGEVMVDPTSIIDNPSEADYIELIKKADGKMFLIKEKGVAMMVRAYVDASGKPVILKKEPLSKSASEVLAKASNPIRANKEQGPNPTTRLYQLKDLLKSLPETQVRK